MAETLETPRLLFVHAHPDDESLSNGATPKRRHQRFIDADEREAVGALVAIIRELRPHVVVTYDPNGGYGHPDPVHTHTSKTAAVAAAGSGAGPADYPGEPWTVPKFYWTVLAESALKTG